MANASESGSAPQANIPHKNSVLKGGNEPCASNRVPNKGLRFVRVVPCLRRNVFSGELWFVGRIRGKVCWRRLHTTDRMHASLKINMYAVNGNTEISIV